MICHSGPDEASRFFGPELLLLKVTFPITIRCLPIQKSMHILSNFMSKSEW